MRIAIRRLAPDLPLPAYATAGSAGLDLLAAVERGEPFLGRMTARATAVWVSEECAALPVTRQR